MADMREFIFFGTATSGNVPNVSCLSKPEPTCNVCLSAVTLDPNRRTSDLFPDGVGPPEHALPLFHKNRRRNTAGAVRYMHSDGRLRTVLIDCGKTFYDSALTWFVEYRLRGIDAVLLTHGHADAMLGLDDLRQWTLGGKAKSVQDYIDVYCSEETLKVVAGAFPYLIDKDKATGGGDIPSLRFHVFGNTVSGFPPFMIDELEVIPFEVEHGKISKTTPFMSLGFRFGNVTYISDASSIPPPSRKLMDGTSTLILDALHYDTHASHFSIAQAVDTSISLLPPSSRLILTGFSHNVDHDTLNTELANNKELKAAGITAQAAYDGLRIFVAAEGLDFDDLPTAVNNMTVVEND